MSPDLDEKQPSSVDGYPVRSPHDRAISHQLIQVLPAVPDSLAFARHMLSEWLNGLRWPSDDGEFILVAANEALSNAIEHAYPAGRPGPMRLHAWVSAGRLERRVTITVTDRGQWVDDNAAHPDEHGGYGLTLMRRCTAAVRIRPLSNGTTVVLVSEGTPHLL